MLVCQESLESLHSEYESTVEHWLLHLLEILFHKGMRKLMLSWLSFATSYN